VNRRLAVGAGLALLAGGVGVGLALRTERAAGPEEALWRTRVRKPDGGELAFAALRGRPLLLNFWATWCAPCVTEMPLLGRFATQHQTWRVVGLAIDHEAPVRAFVAAHRIGFPVGLADANGLDLARALGNTAGGLPFSVAFDAAGRARGRRLGPLDEALLQQWSGLAGTSA
jgi:thiol-disulfide isomerase/thioredoxin